MNFHLCQYVSQNWTIFRWLKELNLFSIWPKRIEFEEVWLTELNIFWTIWLKRIEPSFSIWLKELNPLFQYDPQIWTSLFLIMTRRFEPLFSWLWLADLNLSFLDYDSQIWTSLFLNMTHRIELLFSWIWRKELNLFLQMTQRIEPLSPYDSKNWPLSPNDSKNWFFFSKKYDPKDWIFSDMIHRIEHFWILLTFLNTAQRIEHLLNVTQRTEPFLQHDSENWTLELNMTQRIEPYCQNFDSKNWTFFTKGFKQLNPLKNMSLKNWTLLFNIGQRKWLHFKNVWLKE